MQIPGLAYDGEHLHLRLAGAAAAVDEAVARLAPETIDEGDTWWDALRDLRLARGEPGARLWRLSTPPAATIEAQPLREIVDWGGAQRWWSGSALSAADIHARLRAAVGSQGHAEPMFAATRDEQPPLSATRRALQARLRAAFDPASLFNRGCSRVAA